MTSPLEHAEQIKRLADEYAMTQADMHTSLEQGEQSYVALHTAIDSLSQRCAAAEQKLAEAEADARRLREALAKARDRIAEDRKCLWDCHVRPHSGEVEDAPGLQGLAEYDEVLAAIDQAMESKQ